DGLDLLAESFLALAESRADGGSMPVCPGGLSNDPPEVTVPSLGDGTASGLATAGVFARDGAAVTHQLAGSSEAGQLTDLGHDGHRGHLGDSAERLQGLDDATHVLGGHFHRLVDVPLQPSDAVPGMLHLGDVVEEHGLLRLLIELDVFLDPGQVLDRPGPDPLGGMPAMPKQELAEPVASSELVALRC